MHIRIYATLTIPSLYVLLLLLLIRPSLPSLHPHSPPSLATFVLPSLLVLPDSRAVGLDMMLVSMFRRRDRSGLCVLGSILIFSSRLVR